MLQGNKGEWSEVYVLLKLLSEGRLYVGDADLNKIEDLFYPIIKIIRGESGHNYEYDLQGDLVFVDGDGDKISMPISLFKKNAAVILAKIKSERGTFRINELEDFLHTINCINLTAKSTKKTDIIVVIHDIKLAQSAELGFSIKSQLGGDSTLLNAGKTTNFIYEITGVNFSNNEIIQINSIDTRSKIKDRLIAIQNKGAKLKFYTLENHIFRNNLVLIDSLLPNIIAELIHTFFSSNISSVKDLTDDINKKNTLKYDQQFSHLFYEYKVKKFLAEAALGMMPSKVWTGKYDATGGYLVIKENGDVLCYHLYNRNKFEDYLFHNTKLETASSTRHDFGVVYSENGKLYFKLNLQIRFV